VHTVKISKANAAYKDTKNAEAREKQSSQIPG